MVHRPDVNYPKFKDQFAAMDFEADILPVLSLYPMPEQKALEDWEMKLTDCPCCLYTPCRSRRPWKTGK